MVTTSNGMIQLSRKAKFDPKKAYENPQEFARLIAKLIEMSDLHFMRGFRPLGEWLSYRHFDPDTHPDFAAKQEEEGVVAYQFENKPDLARGFAPLFSSNLHYRLLFRVGVPIWNELVDDVNRTLLGFDARFWVVDRSGALSRVKVSFDPPMGNRQSFGLERSKVSFAANDVSVVENYEWLGESFIRDLNELEPAMRLHGVLEPLQIMVMETLTDLDHQRHRAMECAERIRVTYGALNDVAKVRLIRVGHAGIAPPNRLSELLHLEHVIDLDANPFIPDDWSVEEHCKGGTFKWNAANVSLHLDKGQENGKLIEGNKLREALAGKPVLNACVLDYLIANPHLIPEEWKGETVFFWGTIYRLWNGHLYVRCLHWDDGRWYWSARWLGCGWRVDGPAAVDAR